MSKRSYFVTKVDNFLSLRKCVESGRWACKDRVKPPHPREFLACAQEEGPVVIIFSVVNNHGWHGIAEMTSLPMKEAEQSLVNSQTDEVKTADSQNMTTTSSQQYSEWHYFQLKWILHFLDFGEQCLSSKVTEDLMCVENEKQIPVNKCRNWQQVDSKCGEIICSLMKDFHNTLKMKQVDKEKEAKENIPKPFYEDKETLSVMETWHSIVHKVERDLGKVILACPFGSQRYNLQTPQSDTDMFIVYQARTKDVLGFNTPKQTIKNHETESCDYTIHEVYRYCELLISGDARCVETLFLHDSTVVQASDEWHQLAEGRKLLLNKVCLDKYLRDAQGSKGTKYLNKWCNDNPEATHLTTKMCKMLYVIVRLLQNASDIVNKKDLNVYREDGSTEKEELMKVRAGNVTVTEALNIVHRYESYIHSHSDDVPDTASDVSRFIEDWLLDLRYKDFVSTKMADGSQHNTS